VLRLPVGIRVLDQLGWEADGDRSSYTLEVDAEIAELMREVGRIGRELAADDLDRPALAPRDWDMIDAAIAVGRTV